MLLSPVLKNVRGIKPGQRCCRWLKWWKRNRVPMFSISKGVPRSEEQVRADKWSGDRAVTGSSQLAPLLSVRVLFCTKARNFGKGIKAHYITRSDHKYLYSGGHSSCLEASELSVGLLLTSLDFLFFSAFQIVNKSFKYNQIFWLRRTRSVNLKKTMKYPG